MSSKKNDPLIGIYGKDPIDVSIINYGFKVLIAIVIILFSLPLIFVNETKLFSLVLIVSIGITILFVLIGRLLKKFVYEIKIDYQKKCVHLKIYRTENDIVVIPSELQFKRSFGYLLLSTQNGKYIYNGELSNDLIADLYRIKKMD